MVKRTIALSKKTCIVCQKSFKPASGAQMTCSPACKAEAKAKGLTKRGPRTSGGADSTPAEAPEVTSSPSRTRREAGQVFFNGKPVDAPEGNGGAPRTSPRIPTEEPPALELDLAPLENYIKLLVQREVRQVLKHGITDAMQEALAAKVQQAVREELAERFKGLIGR